MFLIETKTTKYMPFISKDFLLTQMQNIMLILEMLHGCPHFLSNEKSHSHNAI